MCSTWSPWAWAAPYSAVWWPYWCTLTVRDTSSSPMMPQSSTPFLPPRSTPASPTTSTNWTSTTQLKPLRWVLFTHTISNMLFIWEMDDGFTMWSVCECVRCVLSKSIHTFIHCFLISAGFIQCLCEIVSNETRNQYAAHVSIFLRMLLLLVSYFNPEKWTFLLNVVFFIT